MKTKRNSAPEVNAGSMADIAFLLLLFFLVSTTISMDTGINRKLPEPCPKNVDCFTEINERNILRITLNAENKIYVEDQVVSLEDLKLIAKDFLDNNGDATCTYCNGEKQASSSDNPLDAVISLQNNRLTSYNFYIKVQDKLTKAYYELRANYAHEVLKKDINSLTEEELKDVKKAYPFILSEAETKD
ncbi:ExbD/TolR family protein [Ichthyenterobacterium magnum]|uniref:Biopolymer transport protein ExbD n=1 Tax=Ichthyenterobacterium magnum TaxID=1230530 RepID=A0A420DMI8_9FLAO|nr:biopolymer transporter ExbD [Ichthyenterobacterium magnum]RKE95397.1 biopolymer transport protein ExbD [Ichthyenterobacterium magnum]